MCFILIKMNKHLQQDQILTKLEKVNKYLSYVFCLVDYKTLTNTGAGLGKRFHKKTDRFNLCSVPM